MDLDIIAEDLEQDAILAVEVEPTVATPELVDAFLSRFRRLAIPFGMLVDAQHIRLVRKGPDGTTTGEVILRTMDVLTFYDHEFTDQAHRLGSLAIRRDYLRALVEAWLGDLAYHWKSEQPPGAEEVNRAGLLERLSGGMIRSNVNVPVGPLR